MNTHLKGATAVALVAAIAAPAAAQQKSSGPKAVYWVSADTTSGMMAGGVGGMAGMGGMMVGGGMPQDPMAAMAAMGGMSVRGAVAGRVAGMGASLAGNMIAGPIGGAIAERAVGALFNRRARGQAAAATAAVQGQATPGKANFVRTLSLDLGSTQRANGAPAAEHLPPAGLQAGASLPLVSPVAGPAAKGVTGGESYGSGGQPSGKILIYWGCGEKAAAAPITIDFATMAAGKAPNFPTVEVNAGAAPSAGKYTTVGLWPNEKGRVNIPTNGSLAGEHTVRSNYSPEIRFALDQAHDFMAPLNVSHAKSAGGGTRLSWTAIPGATGYFAQVFGSTSADTMVMWSSSNRAASFGPLMDYIPPAEVRRLIGSGVVLPPSKTECVVPAEVMQASPAGMLQMIAYGDEVNVSNPPKPSKAPVEWTAKVRYKSTTTAMLGMQS